MLRSELDVLEFWDDNKTFEKSLTQREGKEPFVFLDGPPFATGTPHWGHLFISQVKDTVLRYQTQKGKYVPRRWGWDCHGVPIEALVEKELNIQDKRQIEEEVGIEEFNNGCRSKISMFDEKWRTIIRRIGRWVDMDDQYRTMDNDFQESVWWGLGQLWKKDLLYKGYRMSLYSPSLGIPLSHTDVAMEVKYKDEVLQTPVTRFSAKKEQTKKLLDRILVQVEANLIEQLKFREEAEKELKVLEKKESKKGMKDFLQKTTNLKSLEGDDFVDGLKASQELTDAQDELEIIKQNISTLEKISGILKDGKTFNLLAWTTTPWTLPSNTCLAVGADIEYSVYYLSATDELVVVAESRAIPTISLHFQDAVTDSEEVMQKLSESTDSSEYFSKLGLDITKVVSLTGKDLEGLEYEPLFEPKAEISSYEKKANLFKIYTADFVTEEEGTGIIHIAPYGPDDFEMINQRNLPILETLNEHGEILDTLHVDLKPVFGKNYEDANPLITQIIKRNGGLFAEIEHTHRAPIFDRNDKKVYYAPQDGWFIAETKLKERSLELNDGINWHPEHLKEGRFGKGLETAPDWCISRSRYWGTALPIWQTEDKSKTIFISSLEELAEQAVNPIYKLINSRDLDPEVYQNHRTVIFGDSHSKLPLGISASQYRSKHLSEVRDKNNIDIKKFSYYAQQMLEEIMDLYEKYEVVQMLLSDEEQVLWTTWLNSLHPNSKKKSNTFYFYKKVKLDLGDYLPVGSLRPLDLHRPYIDDVVLKDEIGEYYHRVEDVLDCWVESGSMPFASWHYPFENKEFVEKNMPADWIVEAQDQTRGWFRVLHVLSNGIFDKAAYKNVSTSGLLMAADGRKMSKSKKNFTPPEELLEKVGSDAIRLHLLSSPLLNAESISLRDDEVTTTFRASTMLLGNTSNFVNFVLDSNIRRELPKKYKHPLNQWWLAYTKDYVAKFVKFMEGYNIMEAARLIIPYIDTFSTWYIRRVKDLLSDHGEEVTACLVETIKMFSIATASVQPFNTERLWSVVKNSKDAESVHLTDMIKPVELVKSEKLSLVTMDRIRELVSEAHSMRKEREVRVRQPLYVDTSGLELDDMYIDIIRRECNLLEKDMTKTEGEVWENTSDLGIIRIDKVVDDELAILGFVRDFERSIQNLRKKQGYRPSQIVAMQWQKFSIENEEIFEKVIEAVNWKKLHVDITWVEDELDQNIAKHIKVKGLCEILAGI